jgi:glycosyltransferase involved in cell wall biosynthesis
MFLGAYDLESEFPGSVALAQHADVVWTHAHVNVSALQMRGIPAERIRVAHRGIDITHFKSNGSPKVPHRLVTAGRLCKEKAVDEVLTIMAKIYKRYPMSTLVIMGDGPERSRLEALAHSLGLADAVTFVGLVDHMRVQAEMAAAEVFVSMSRKHSERLPNVVKEAMASRCVCVVSRTPGISELLEDGVHGFVVPQGDIEMAAERIEQIFSEKSKSWALAKRASKHVTDYFDVRRTMNIYIDRWHTLVGTGCPSSMERDQA